MKNERVEARAQGLSLDFVSAMAVECWGGIMGHGRILLSVDLARSQLFFVNLWDGRNPLRLHQMSHKRGMPNQSPGEE